MVRIAYITDMHWEGDGSGFHYQPPCQEKLPTLLSALTAELQKGNVELLLLGGDMTEKGSPDQIEHVAACFSSMPMEVRLLLGNHDLAERDSFATWLERCSSLLEGDKTSPWGDFAILKDDTLLVGLQNTWSPQADGVAHYWDAAKPLQGDLLEEQFQWLEQIFDLHSDNRIIVCMHEMLFPLYPEQTGLEKPIHAPKAPGMQRLLRILHGAKNVRLVLSGHCHATSLHRENHTAFLTTAAFVEPPFQYRLICIDDASIQVSVGDFASLASDSPFDASRSWVMGKKESRDFEIA